VRLARVALLIMVSTVILMRMREAMVTSTYTMAAPISARTPQVKVGTSLNQPTRASTKKLITAAMVAVCFTGVPTSLSGSLSTSHLFSRAAFDGGDGLFL